MFKFLRIMGAILFGAGAVMMEVSPDQVVSNLSQWWKLVAPPPKWLLPPTMDKWGAVVFFILFLIVIRSTIVHLFKWLRKKTPLFPQKPALNHENLDEDKLNQRILEAFVRFDSNEPEKRKDLLVFLRRWYESGLDFFHFLNKNLVSFEKEIGRYRFDKLFVPLREMKIYNLTRGKNGNLIGTPFNDLPYDKTYIENIINDVKNGCQDRYLQ